MSVIRSFNSNKAYKSYKTLSGGIIGGSINCGVLNVNDFIERNSTWDY